MGDAFFYSFVYLACILFFVYLVWCNLESFSSCTFTFAALQLSPCNIKASEKIAARLHCVPGCAEQSDGQNLPAE
jgi:hypothetical protein